MQYLSYFSRNSLSSVSANLSRCVDDARTYASEAVSNGLSGIQKTYASLMSKLTDHGKEKYSPSLGSYGKPPQKRKKDNDAEKIIEDINAGRLGKAASRIERLRRREGVPLYSSLKRHVEMAARKRNSSYCGELQAYDRRRRSGMLRAGLCTFGAAAVTYYTFFTGDNSVNYADASMTESIQTAATAAKAYANASLDQIKSYFGGNGLDDLKQYYTNIIDGAGQVKDSVTGLMKELFTTNSGLADEIEFKIMQDKGLLQNVENGKHWWDYFNAVKDIMNFSPEQLEHLKSSFAKSYELTGHVPSAQALNDSYLYGSSKSLLADVNSLAYSSVVENIDKILTLGAVAGGVAGSVVGNLYCLKNKIHDFMSANMMSLPGAFVGSVGAILGSLAAYTFSDTQTSQYLGAIGGGLFSGSFASLHLSRYN